MKKYLQAILLIFWFCSPLLAQQSEDEKEFENVCAQSRDVRLKIIDTAETSKYTVRRIEISGNFYTRHNEFVKRSVLREGDFFTKKSLDGNIRNFSKMRVIKPISVENVRLWLDDENKEVDLVFCVEERRKK